MSSTVIATTDPATKIDERVLVLGNDTFTVLRTEARDANSDVEAGHRAILEERSRTDDKVLKSTLLLETIDGLEDATPDAVVPRRLVRKVVSQDQEVTLASVLAKGRLTDLLSWEPVQKARINKGVDPNAGIYLDGLELISADRIAETFKTKENPDYSDRMDTLRRWQFVDIAGDRRGVFLTFGYAVDGSHDFRIVGLSPALSAQVAKHLALPEVLIRAGSFDTPGQAVELAKRLNERNPDRWVVWSAASGRDWMVIDSESKDTILLNRSEELGKMLGVNLIATPRGMLKEWVPLS